MITEGSLNRVSGKRIPTPHIKATVPMTKLGELLNHTSLTRRAQGIGMTLNSIAKRGSANGVAGFPEALYSPESPDLNFNPRNPLNPKPLNP